MNGNDNINLEYEERVMITENQYSQIVEEYSKYEQKKIVNTNYYFDYEDLQLTNSGMVLRARNIDDQIFELTLKIKQENGDIEVNHPLTSNEFLDIIKNEEIPDSEVLVLLNSKNIDLDRIKLITSLKTERIEIEFPEYLFVIDKNYYNNKVDFNLEVESTSKKDAKTYLNQIISQFGIENKKDYISKSRRAIYNL